MVPPNGGFGAGTIWVESEGSVKTAHVVEARPKGVVRHKGKELLCQVIPFGEAPG